MMPLSKAGVTSIRYVSARVPCYWVLTGGLPTITGLNRVLGVDYCRPMHDALLFVKVERSGICDLV